MTTTVPETWLEREIGPGGIEGRVGPVATEARAKSGDDGKGIEGHASVFNTPTRVQGFFRDWEEEVAEGAFTKTLKESKRILSAFNHDLGRLLGTTDSKTARFSEDDVGLLYDVDIDERDPLAMSVWSQVDTRKVNGASIWFRVVRHEVTMPADDDDDALPKRKILEVQLFEGGPVVNPAFETTTATTRDAMALDSALRALDAPKELRASLAIDAMFDPPRFESRLSDLLKARPALRDAVCGPGCSCGRAGDQPPAPGTPPSGHLPPNRRRDVVMARARGFAALQGLRLKEDIAS